MSDERPICQLCGGPIEGEVYRWNDDERLTMHRYFSQCLNGSFGMAGFMARNSAYLFGDAEPVLLKEAP